MTKQNQILQFSVFKLILLTLLFSAIFSEQIEFCAEMDEEKNICIKCDDNYFLTQNQDQCLENCPDGQYPNEQQQCQECQQGTYPKINDEQQWICTDCGFGCEKCYSLERCEICENSEYYSYEGICIQYCDIEDGEYIEENDGEQQFCFDCMENCDQCDNDITCKFCSEGFFIDINLQCVQNCGNDKYGDIEDRICKKCQDGTYLNPDLKDGETDYCLSCPQGCSQCIQANSCEKCEFGKKVKADDGSCFVTCPTKKGYFKDSEGNCLSCPSNCAECENKDLCTYCDQDYFMQYEDQNGNCQETCNGDPDQVYANLQTRKCEICGDGKYKIPQPDKPFEYCGDCQQNCRVCKDADSLCQKCYSNYKYKEDDGSCFSKCDIGNGQYEQQESDGEGYFCLQCMENCNICEDNQSCQLCNNQTYYQNDSCQEKCLDGEYADDQDRVCKNCSLNCAHCTGKNQCTDCSKGYLFKQACVDQCPTDGYYGKQNVCEKCIEGCQLCEDDLSCQKCKFFKILDNKNQFKKCDDECPKLGYFETQDQTSKEHQCKECIMYCDQCTTQQDCTKCTEGTFLNNFYKDTDNQISECQMCNIKCKSCELQADRCLECALQDYPYLEHHQCVQACSKGYYIDKNNICIFDDSTNEWWVYLLVIVGIVLLLGIFTLIIVRYRKGKRRNTDQRSGSNGSDYISIQEYNNEQQNNTLQSDD